MGKEFRSLPYPGSLLQQPEMAMRKLEIIIEVIADIEDTQIKRSEAEAKVRRGD